MNCYRHPDREAAGACTSCGKPICNECLVEVQGKLVCRDCLAAGRTSVAQTGQQDPNTAFLIEMVGGFFGFLGLGYFYTGRTNDGIIRLICWLGYLVVSYIIVATLSAIFIGILCIPIQLCIQIGIPIWSANKLKKEMMGIV